LIEAFRDAIGDPDDLSDDDTEAIKEVGQQMAASIDKMVKKSVTREAYADITKRTVDALKQAR
jgi:hypothetical protein